MCRWPPTSSIISTGTVPNSTLKACVCSNILVLASPQVPADQPHVYTLVWLKSDQIGFHIVELKHPDYSIDSHALLLHVYTPAVRIGLCVVRRRKIFPRGREPEVDGWQQRRFSSEIPARKSTIVHLVCVIIMYTIYEVYKDVASSRSSYAIFLKCRGSWWHKEVSRRCLCYH